jgi:signal transduction histidine kinase
VRHSGAWAAQVALRYEDGRTHLSVSDQGCGFDPAAPHSARSVGLDSMAERAAALGGDLAVESAPGQGTTIRVTIPTAVL